MRKLYFAMTIVCISCYNGVKEETIVATIEKETIQMSSIDNLIQDQLYESLFGIYYKRKIALEEYIGHKVIQIEAIEKKMSEVDLIKKEIDTKITQKGIDDFIAERQFAKGVPDPNNPVNLIKIETEEGKKLLVSALKDKLLAEYVSSLMEKYKVSVKLSPPLSPKKKMYQV